MIKQFINDIKWKHLAISYLIALLTFVILSLVVDFIKTEAFDYSLDRKWIEFPQKDDFQEVYSGFMQAFYWQPAHIIVTILIQFVSCSYLMKKSKNYEYTNAIANAILISFTIFRFNMLHVPIGFCVSLYVAHNAKDKKSSNIIELKEKKP